MTRATAALGVRFRNKKLSTKAPLSIVREDASTRIEEDQQRNIQTIETGVEKGEEIEHHLQAAIKSNQAAALGRKGEQAAIPTPQAGQSSVEYRRLYTARFSQPATYIRFSSTVEDCSGPKYCMTTEDDEFFKKLGPRTNTPSAKVVCTEDMFEQVMTFFEDTAADKQPYASVGTSPVVEYDEFEAVFDETLTPDTRLFAREIYEHWKTRRLARNNQSLLTMLKFETGAETDDADPYICFRRREIRNVRKTRGRDAFSVEKLKSLRLQLEDSRNLMFMVKQREAGRKDIIAVDRAIFEARTKLRGMKMKLNNTDMDEELLIHQRPPKRKPLDQVPQSANRVQQRLRADGPVDLVTLKEVLAQRQAEIENEISNKISQHRKWNEGFVDDTRAPFSESPIEHRSKYRTVVTQPLPTPPESASSTGFPTEMDVVEEDRLHHEPTRQVDSSLKHPEYPQTPPELSPSEADFPKQFRYRIGRGGRRWLDRIGGPAFSKNDVDPWVVDRFKYDQESDDNDEDDYFPSVFHIDQFSAQNMKYRSNLLSRDSAAQQHGARSHSGSITSGSRPRPVNPQPSDTPMSNGASTAGLPMSSSPTHAVSSQR